MESFSPKTDVIENDKDLKIIAEVPDSDASDVDRAVAAAKNAFENGPWANSTAQDRGRVLFKLADAVRQNTSFLAELEARNNGKPRGRAFLQLVWHSYAAVSRDAPEAPAGSGLILPCEGPGRTP